MGLSGGCRCFCPSLRLVPMEILDPGWVTPAEYGQSPVPDDPDFVRAAQWLAAGTDEEPAAVVLGIPFSSLSLSGAKCDLFPRELRKSLWTFSTFAAEHDVDLQKLAVMDLGDLMIPDDIDGALARIEEAAARLRTGSPVVFIGGDNSITAPAMLGSVGNEGGLITFDAHHDLRDYKRDGLSNGSPVRVLIDSGVKGDAIWQIGIKDFANSKAYSELAESEGIHVVGSTNVRSDGIGPAVREALDDLGDRAGIYIDFDLDVVDRALAPGAPAAQPGGLFPADLLEAAFICGTHRQVRAIDLVEVDPERDVAGSTVRLAALVLLSFLAGVAGRS